MKRTFKVIHEIRYTIPARTVTLVSTAIRLNRGGVGGEEVARETFEEPAREVVIKEGTLLVSRKKSEADSYLFNYAGKIEEVKS